MSHTAMHDSGRFRAPLQSGYGTCSICGGPSTAYDPELSPYRVKNRAGQVNDWKSFPILGCYDEHEADTASSLLTALRLSSGRFFSGVFVVSAKQAERAALNITESSRDNSHNI